MNKLFYKNLQYAFMAQFISVFFSLIMYLIVPKIIGITNYAYWQLFIFYSNYAGFFHLGLVDGIYLKIGGKEYNELNFKSLGSQLKIMSLIQIISAVIFMIIINFINIEIDRKFIFLSTLIYIIIYCIENYLGFILQAVNKTKKYSIAVIIEKTICLFSIFILLILKVDNYKYYVLTYVVSKILNILWLSINCKEIINSSFAGIRETFRDIKSNILVGIILMFSGIAGSLIVGNGRVVIDNLWGIETFGRISFSISILNMILLFIKQISMVLFPTLRQAKEEKQKQIYINVRDILYIILPVIFIFYIPGKMILANWLPQYADSLKYLAITLPICIYDAKIQILGNTYFKVLRKEKRLLIINCIAMITSLILSILFGYIFKNINLILVGIVISIIIRSVYSEKYLHDMYEIHDCFVKKIIIDIIITSIFMATSWFMPDNWNNIIIMIICYFAFLYLNKDLTQKVYMIFKRKTEVNNEKN